MRHFNAYEFVNDTVTEMLGVSVVLSEDLSNIVDVGEAILSTGKLDEYCQKIVNKVGKTVIVDRPYESSLPSILIDGVEYGSIIEKIWVDIPKASENETWGLVDGASYDSAVFYKPTVSTKFFNERSTFEVDMSITDIQLKQSFKSASALTSFIRAIYTAISNAVTVALDNLCKRAINNYVAETMYNYNSAGTYTGTGNTRAVNLLKLYNDMTGSSLTADKCLSDKSFLRYAMYMINITSDRLTKLSKLFNMEGAERFTPKESQTFVCLSDFDRAVKVNLLSGEGQFNNDNLTMPSADIIPYWQGSGQSYSFADISKIKVKTADGHTVEVSGVLVTLFDKNACAVALIDRRTRTHYSDKAEFTNIFEKVDTGLINSFDENFVVFYVA